jgi:ubiquinone/menaquinone biosynthesis C-methylase UbiE
VDKKKDPIKLSVREIYDESRESYETFLAALDLNLNPRSPDVLYDKFNDLGPLPESIVLDAGCRDAAHACELSQRFGCRVVGVDLVDANVQGARKRIAEERLQRSVQVVQGDIQRFPFMDETFDLIWCRDVLVHMPDLTQAFRSCARVLKPGGKMLIYQMFTTDLLTPEEATQFFSPLALIPENMTRDYFEGAYNGAGFSLVEADIISSEWREYGEETESKITSKQMLRIARMRRNRERLIAEFGEKRYACELANCHWGVYQMLGKLCPIVYTLTK